MFLAYCVANLKNELIADFQQYYNLCIKDIGKDSTYDYYYISILASQLPPKSRVMSEFDSSLSWDDTNYLLSRIEFNIRALICGLSKKKGNNNEQKPIEPTNRREVREKEEREKKERLTIEGFKIIPQTEEELKKVWGH